MGTSASIPYASKTKLVKLVSVNLYEDLNNIDSTVEHVFSKLKRTPIGDLDLKNKEKFRLASHATFVHSRKEIVEDVKYVHTASFSCNRIYAMESVMQVDASVSNLRVLVVRIPATKDIRLPVCSNELPYLHEFPVDAEFLIQAVDEHNCEKIDWTSNYSKFRRISHPIIGTRYEQMQYICIYYFSYPNIVHADYYLRVHTQEKTSSKKKLTSVISHALHHSKPKKENLHDEAFFDFTENFEIEDHTVGKISHKESVEKKASEKRHSYQSTQSPPRETAVALTKRDENQLDFTQFHLPLSVGLNLIFVVLYMWS